MASLTKKNNIFFVTSPRSPFKMREEIKLLIDNFSGQIWNTKTQTEYAKLLSESDFFRGTIKLNFDLAARDRITRGPKSLGFVDLKPTIKLTPSGKEFLGDNPEEILLRQLMKFQLPSPYHVDKSNRYNIKPYLELLRLIFELGYIKKEEIAIYFIKLINIAQYDEIKKNIIDDRKRQRERDKSSESYKTYVDKIYTQSLSDTFRDSLSNEQYKVRQNQEVSYEKFIKTKKRNFKDYADASLRYLRGAGLIELELNTYHFVINQEKKEEIQHLLNTVKREAQSFTSEEDYENYLFNNEIPVLLTDDKSQILKEISVLSPETKITEEITLSELKQLHAKITERRKNMNIEILKGKLRTYDCHENIIKVFEDIQNRKAFDPSLLLEWNTWRSFEMLDDGVIEGNLRLDEVGNPVDTAKGNMADMVCRYENFSLIVEVTTSTGQKQYEMEGEPVGRHYGLYKKQLENKELYCIFLTSKLNPATLAYFFMLHRTNIGYYGGVAKIIPVEIADFIKILNFANKNKPKSVWLKNLLNEMSDSALRVSTESEWINKIKMTIDALI
ncbi:AlwI family type II restriction endonuclease [Candidatus Dojkabacteria bacterium]|jgi:hypothetical protein|nr:AlwI family type II restriction endonuclease [Candidatus Dojkabacteria bacterium]